MLKSLREQRIADAKARRKEDDSPLLGGEFTLYFNKLQEAEDAKDWEKVKELNLFIDYLFLLNRVNSLVTTDDDTLVEDIKKQMVIDPENERLPKLLNEVINPQKDDEDVDEDDDDEDDDEKEEEDGDDE
jgi:hypothetical protein